MRLVVASRPVPATTHGSCAAARPMYVTSARREGSRGRLLDFLQSAASGELTPSFFCSMAGRRCWCRNGKPASDAEVSFKHAPGAVIVPSKVHVVVDVVARPLGI